ncbi:hypothetical protein HRbin17_02141 [bacterium HR17]|uniref:DUF1559 domain-containing protein n=1 Tax=Candidatus Fervidibacter japonicus TaxID=2035412 RepID=A0A2H5XEL3_9BACT|nr:hypothetical protein HRbin17_02141 [bacterium HR17]
MRRALTLTELLTVIGVLATLAGILLPALWHAREKSRQAACLSNLRQITVAVLEYAHDWDDVLPFSAYQARDGLARPCLVTVSSALRSLQGTPLPSCPTEPQAFHTDGFLRAVGLTGGECNAAGGGSYALNTAVFVPGDAPLLGWRGQRPLRLGDLPMPSVTASVYDGNVAFGSGCGFARLSPALQGRHHEAVNIGFMDGHARSWRSRPSGCSTRNINGDPLAEECLAVVSPYQRRCFAKAPSPCPHDLTGVPERDQQGDCVIVP